MYLVIRRGFINGVIICWKLAKIIVPVYILMQILAKSGVLDVFAGWCAPLMTLLGLPGEAALALVLGNTVGIYGVLGVIPAMDLTFKQINILSMMLLTSHSLPTEFAVLHQAGVNALLLTLLRLVISIVAGILMNLIF